MADSHILSILSKKYAKLLGEHAFADRMTEDANGLQAIVAATERSDKRKREIDELLSAIETVVWLFHPDWDPGAIRPIPPRKKYLKPSAISRATYAILKDAKVALTTRQISHVVAARLGYTEPEERDMARLDGAIYAALSKRVGVTIEIVNENPIRWAIIPRDRVQQSRTTPSTTETSDEITKSVRSAFRRYAS